MTDKAVDQPHECGTMPLTVDQGRSTVAQGRLFLRVRLSKAAARE
ncbi:hypothetical protein [Streptomyces sp. NPDC002564]